mmetsp:Transcript_25868/g.59543  ORF Transcript_25868/g.59543 Transcript_25868/m.59543 type:complete len:219 (+) Transcript_25868:276-932(+)
MQAHWNAAGVGESQVPTPRQLKEQIRRLGNLGLTVNLSEMDVRVSQLENPEFRPMAQKQIYHDLVAAAVSEPACDGIWLWGFTDRHTWVTHFYYDDEPLILDEHYHRKQAYFGLREALVTLTPHGSIGGNTPLDSDLDVDGNQWGYPWKKESPSMMMSDGLMRDSDARPDWEVERAKSTTGGEEKEPPRPSVSDVSIDESLDEEDNPLEFKAPDTEIS